MQLKVLMLISCWAVVTSAYAQFFPAQAFVRVLPVQVSAQVVNPHFQPIVCSGQVFGQTAYGITLNAHFVEQMLPPGGHRFAFVQTTPYQPFINGWSNIHCRFIY